MTLAAWLNVVVTVSPDIHVPGWALVFVAVIIVGAVWH